MKAKKVHITLTNENLYNVDSYAKDNNMKFRSTAVNDLIQKGLEYNNITKLVEEIKILQIKLLGYAKTLEYFDKVLITALDIKNIKDPNSNPVINNYYKYTKGDHSD